MATHGKSSSYLERKKSAGYTCQCRGLYLQTTGRGLSKDTENGAFEIDCQFFSLTIKIEFTGISLDND